MNKFLQWFYRLSWQKLLGGGALLLAIAVTPIIVRMANTPTRTQSEAALLTRTEPISKEFESPAGPPEIFLVDHFFGKVGDAVLVHGDNLGGFDPATKLYINNTLVTEADLVTWTGDFIEFKVPNNAKSGKVAVEILGRRDEWEGSFYVVNNSTLGEAALDKLNASQAQLKIAHVSGAKKLLVWLLNYYGAGELRVASEPGVRIETRRKEFPIGTVEELIIELDDSLSQRLDVDWVNLATVTKVGDQMVGIARVEVMEPANAYPIKVDPLKVSF